MRWHRSPCLPLDLHRFWSSSRLFVYLSLADRAGGYTAARLVSRPAAPPPSRVPGLPDQKKLKEGKGRNLLDIAGERS